jgi:DNA-directed RNA polymerase beta subunit
MVGKAWIQTPAIQGFCNVNTQVDPLFSLPLPDHMRGFFDPVKTRKWVNQTAKESYQKVLNNLESPAYKLKVTDIELHEPKKPFSYKEQNKALMEKKDLTIPLKGSFEMIDKKTGEVIDRKTTTIAHIPWVTERNTSILHGSEYILSGQARLKSGVYARVKESGEAEAHVNVIPGSGMGGKVIFHPDRALFVYQVGTTQIKLYGLLHDLGTPDADMEKAWGHEIYMKNKQEYTGNEVEKMHDKILGKE